MLQTVGILLECYKLLGDYWNFFKLLEDYWNIGMLQTVGRLLEFENC